MADFDYYKSPATQFDFSPLSEAGRTYARAGEDVGASIRDAAKMLMIQKEAKKDRDMRERMGAADRANALFRDFLGEQGANSRSNATIGASNARSEEARQAQMRGQDMTLEAAMERERGRAARADAAEKAKAQAIEEKKANDVGAFRLLDAMQSDDKVNPLQKLKRSSVDLDPALGSIWAQGGEKGLIAHFKAKGMEDAEAGQAAKAALKPTEYPFLDEGRLRQYRARATELFGPEASDKVASQLMSEHGTHDQVMERLRGANASSMGAAFKGKTESGREAEPHVVMPDGSKVADPVGFSKGGTFEEMTDAQRQYLTALALDKAMERPEWPTEVQIQAEIAANKPGTGFLGTGLAAKKGVSEREIRQEAEDTRTMLTAKIGNRIAAINKWTAGGQAPAAQGGGLQNASGEEILQHEIEAGTIDSDEKLEKRAKELGVKLK